MIKIKILASITAVSLLMCGCSSAETVENAQENNVPVAESTADTDSGSASQTETQDNDTSEIDSIDSIRELYGELDTTADGYGSSLKMRLIEKTKDDGNYYYETDDGSLTFKVVFIQPDYATSSDEYAITLYVTNNTENTYYIDPSEIYAVSRIEGGEYSDLKPVCVEHGETKELCTTNSVIAREDGTMGLRFNNAQIVDITNKTMRVLTDDYDDPYPLEITIVSLT